MTVPERRCSATAAPISQAQRIVAAVLDDAIVLSRLEPGAVDDLLREPERVQLRRANSPVDTAMLIALQRHTDGVRIRPRFGLMAGARYALHVRLSAGEPWRTSITVPAVGAVAPTLLNVSPSAERVPSNLLRLYLTFSTPMALGQMRNHIWLADAAGARVESAFLDLEHELWDARQQRLTLLFDPGRLKKGVGPRMHHGTPLSPHRTYAVVIDQAMHSAAGRPLRQAVIRPLRTGAPIQTRLAPDRWRIRSPIAGTRRSLQVQFDRLIDQPGARRWITPVHPEGRRVDGEVTTDGQQWCFVPHRAWAPGRYGIRVASALEDVCGNTMEAAFDAPVGRPSAGSGGAWVGTVDVDGVSRPV